MQQIPQFSPALFEADEIAVLRLVQRGEVVAAQGAVLLFSLPNRRCRAITEKARADHDTRVIVQVERGRADFDGDAGHIEPGIGSED